MRRFTPPLFSAALFALSGVALAARAEAGPMRQVMPALASAQVSLAVHLPLHNRPALEALLANQVDARSPLYHHFLTPQQFATSFGPTAHDRAVTLAELRRLGFTVDAVTPHDVDFHGSARTVEAAFRTTVVQRQGALGRLSTHPATDLVPTAALSALGATLFHKSHIAIRHTNSRIVATPSLRSAASPQSRYGPTSQAFWFDDLKQAYSYPSYQDLTGRGRTIAILMSGDFLESDLKAYFGHEKLKPPTVLRRPVDGGAVFDPNSGGSFEMALDIQQSGGMAPGATIVTYNMPDLTDQNIYDGYTAIVDDNRADIVNSSFGGAELYYTSAYTPVFGTSPATLEALHDVFLQGSLQGISFVASSGDEGAYGAFNLLDYFTTGTTNLHFVKSAESPADDPLVTAVGGTNLQTISRPDPGTLTGYPYSLDSTYKSENAFGDPLLPQPDPFFLGATVTGGIWGSGGGESIFFARPSYQNGFTASHGRALPDLSGHMGGCPGGVNLIADPACAQPSAERSYDLLAFNYEALDPKFYYGVIGTSASAPDFAGLLALTEERFNTRLGPVNYLAYAYALPGSGVHAYRANIRGNNGLLTKPGYDEVLGLGSVIGNEFAQTKSVAGLPRSPSNP